jgi:CheY-like chemotaxis protein
MLSTTIVGAPRADRDLARLEGYAVRTAGNGREALAILKEEPCLMVVDLNMPVMDGAELRRQH